MQEGLPKAIREDYRVRIAFGEEVSNPKQLQEEIELESIPTPFVSRQSPTTTASTTRESPSSL